MKHTNRVGYAIDGLRELADYMKYIKDKDGNYLADVADVRIEGMLFTDALPDVQDSEGDLVLTAESEGDKVRVVRL